MATATKPRTKKVAASRAVKGKADSKRLSKTGTKASTKASTKAGSKTGLKTSTKTAAASIARRSTKPADSGVDALADALLAHATSGNERVLKTFADMLDRLEQQLVAEEASAPPARRG